MCSCQQSPQWGHTSCLGGCEDDTLATRIEKLTQAVCALGPVDISKLKLYCLKEKKPTTLQALLQALIEQVCGKTGSLPVDPTVLLPSGSYAIGECNEYEDPLTGDYISALPLADVLRLLTDQNCRQQAKIQELEATQLLFSSRLRALESR